MKEHSRLESIIQWLLPQTSGPSLAMPACQCGCTLATVYCLVLTQTHSAQQSSIVAKATAELWLYLSQNTAKDSTAESNIM